tara:strand:- start:2103 stop:3290 length:1188 start_codon:yes stop_codon:yes gene_type:complete
MQENHGERLRLVLLHVGDTNTLAAVATLARLGDGRTLVENLCVRDQHRSRGLTRNLLDGIATSSEDNDLFIFARSQVILEVCQSSKYVCLEGDDRKRVVNSFVQETDLAYDSRYYLKVPLLKYATGTPRDLPGHNRSLEWEEYGTQNEEDGTGAEDDVARIEEDHGAHAVTTMSPAATTPGGVRNEEGGTRDNAVVSNDATIRKDLGDGDCHGGKANAVQVKRLPDGPVTPYKSQAEAARSEGWSTSALSNWFCGKETKYTIPAGYAIRRSTSDDWIRHDSGHDYGGTVNNTTPSSGATTSGGATSTSNEDGFLKEGPYMNCRLSIQRPRYAAYGTVVKYLPGSENDGIELWKVRHDDGDEEDVELQELMEWICKRPKGRAPGGMRWEGGRWVHA